MMIINFGNFCRIDYAINVIRIGNVDDDIFVIPGFQLGLIFKISFTHRGNDPLVQRTGKINFGMAICLIEDFAIGYGASQNIQVSVHISRSDNYHAEILTEPLLIKFDFRGLFGVRLIYEGGGGPERED